MITTLIPSSPIPSHPSTKILDETIANVRMYTGGKIIIMFDGVHHSVEHRREQYEEYKADVMLKVDSGEYGWASYVVFPEHTHQARMTKEVLAQVNTPLVLFCEHDTSPIGDIPFNEICDLVLNSQEINCLRFNIFHEIPREHSELMLGVHTVGNITYTRTIQWSQRPHVAKTEWYKMVLENNFNPNHKTMIEDVMHSVVQVAYHSSGADKFGLAIYTPTGNQLRSYHADGRGEDEKVIEG